MEKNIASMPPSFARGRSNWPSATPVTDVAAVIQLAIDRMHVTIEYESLPVEFSGALRNLRLRCDRASQEGGNINESHECVFRSAAGTGPRLKSDSFGAR